MNPDWDGLAETIVRTCTGVREGEVVQLGGGIHNFPFLARLALAVRKAGAFPELSITSDELQVRTLQEVPLRYLRQVPRHRLRWLDDVDALIVTDGVADARAGEAVAAARREAVQAAGRPVQERILERRIRWTYLVYPTPTLAEECGLPFPELARLVWGALAVDYEAMTRRGAPLRAALEGAREVWVRSPAGTDLTFSLEGRRVLLEDGIISPEDRERGEAGNHLPAGEVYGAPLEASARGRAVFERVLVQGRVIEGLELRFAGGKVVEARAQSGLETFQEVMGHAEGDPRVLAEFGVGLNPALDRLTGCSFTDEKMAGTVHIALGENRAFGGQSAATLHWDLVMTRPTVLADGKPLLEEGRLQIAAP